MQRTSPVPLGHPVVYRYGAQGRGHLRIGWLITWAPTHAVVLLAAHRREVGLTAAQVKTLRPPPPGNALRPLPVDVGEAA